MYQLQPLPISLHILLLVSRFAAVYLSLSIYLSVWLSFSLYNFSFISISFSLSLCFSLFFHISLYFSSFLSRPLSLYLSLFPSLSLCLSHLCVHLPLTLSSFFIPISQPYFRLSLSLSQLFSSNIALLCAFQNTSNTFSTANFSLTPTFSIISAITKLI